MSFPDSTDSHTWIHLADLGHPLQSAIALLISDTTSYSTQAEFFVVGLSGQLAQAFYIQTSTANDSKRDGCQCSRRPRAWPYTHSRTEYYLADNLPLMGIKQN